MSILGWIARIIGGRDAEAKPSPATSSTASARTLAQDIPEMANWIAKALKSSGYKADFSPGSIAEVERFFAAETVGGLPKSDGLLADGLGGKLFALGSYCGETLRRELGGTWQTDDSDPKGEVNAALQFADGSICWPMQRMVKRVQGEDANLVHWAAVLRGDAGETMDVS